ncbi:MAG: hypothetical protein XD50_0542 [Clostridia bacterium 41_269]|nr:MAG: hypothetical protein XD50_0542 [Clostridia bacterium 41_269]
MVLIILAALFPFYWQPAQSMVYNLGSEEILYKLVENSGAKPVELMVQGWTKVNRSYMEISPLKRTALKTAERLGVRNPELKVEESRDFRQVRVQHLSEDGTLISIAAQSLINYTLPNRAGETYVTVSLARKINVGEKHYWSSRVKTALSFPGGSTPQVLTNITAVYPGKLSLKAKRELVDNLFSAAKAKKIGGVENSELVSCTGFAPGIREKIKLGKNFVNLNVALRYHNSDGQTYIYIGSPLLVGEY